MFVSDSYLEKWATAPGRAVKVAATGLAPGNAAINVDDPDDTCLSILHCDENPDDTPDAELFDTKGVRRTFVTPMRDGDAIEDVAYRFEGLIKPTDLRTWYRKKIGLDRGKKPIAA
jgi:hypothetical protein